MSFEEIADWVAELPDDDRVHEDPVHGHIRLGEVVFADMGSTLSCWTYCGHTLTPGLAHDLGGALVRWAERKTSGSGGGRS